MENNCLLDDFLEVMTLQQKIALIGGDPDHMGTRAIERLGLPALTFADGPMGVHSRNLPAPAYPALICLAATFDPALARNMGTCLGMDCRQRGVHVLLGPGVNLHRLPLCGRNFEYCGEDPVLAGNLAVAYIEGLQQTGVAACIKHYACNYQEYDRHGVSSNVDERTLHEVYLPAFQKAVQAGVACVMTAYNPLNGEHMSENRRLVHDILKRDWGFDGVVMSDWTSTYHAIPAANHGLDLEMPTGKHFNEEQLLMALANGCVTKTVINDKARRLLRLILGYGPGAQTKGVKTKPDAAADDRESEACALRVARAGQVLLKNNGVLPLDRTRIKRIAVIGRQAGQAVISGGGSAHGRPAHSVTLEQALRNAASDRIEIRYHVGVDPWRFGERYKDSVLHLADGRPGVLAEYFNNNQCTGEPVLRREEERLDFFWKDGTTPAPAVTAELFSMRMTTGFSATDDGEHVIYTSCSDGGYRLFIDGRLHLDCWYSEISRPFATRIDLRAGQYAVITVEYRKARHWAGMHLGWEPCADFDVDSEAAVTAAREADAVILAAGYMPQTEAEGFDRDFELHPAINTLILRVSDANPRTIVALYAGSAVNCEPWIDRVAGLLHLWYPGMNGAEAAAGILFGDSNPSGRLPITWARRLEDYSAALSYHDKGTRQVQLADGVFYGYRHFRRHKIAPRFAFGFGLSYTAFEITVANLDCDTLKGDGVIMLSCKIKNLGPRAGTDTVLLFIGENEPRIPRPQRELRAFQRITLEPGEEGDLHFAITSNMLRYYDPDQELWRADPGAYTCTVARHADDAGLAQTFQSIECM